MRKKGREQKEGGRESLEVDTVGTSVSKTAGDKNWTPPCLLPLTPPLPWLQGGKTGGSEGGRGEKRKGGGGRRERRAWGTI